MLLKSVEFPITDERGYPYELPFFGKKIEFKNPITILVGENGAGKSSLLKMMNDVVKLYRIEGVSNNTAKKGSPLKSVFDQPIVSYYRTKPKGFFFSAEDFTT